MNSLTMKRRTKIWNVGKLLVIFSVLIQTSSCVDIRKLKNIFEDPKPGTEGVTFVRCPILALQSAIGPLNSPSIDKLHITLEGLTHNEQTVNLTFLWTFTRLTHFWITTESQCTGRRIDTFTLQHSFQCVNSSFCS